ncbi:hypothetical protein Bca52824_029317 [Brassica carinata]|uniref:Rab-GAP TBC domain-containing protein n=1 Tax=Brassica carinata TaxID=52824 RepID=A0A8X7VE01_BRACI|nr:hypothetical protein Bca52824_029317 [Brassica carinata]
MCSGGEGKQWSCGKAGVVSLQKVGSLVRDLSEPCLSQSHIQVVIITIGKMLKPEKWQASFDSEGRVSGFQKALKLIILGGIDPSIRAEVWEFLLGCYSLSSTSEHRNQLRAARSNARRCIQAWELGLAAYVVGSKVMDMRKSYRDEAVKVATTDENREEASVDDNNDNANAESHHSDWSSNNGGADTSHVHRRGSSSESVDLASGRESPESVVYNTSSFVSASSPYGFPSPDGYFDFPSLPVTDLFGRNSLDQIEVSTPDKDASLHRELRTANADLVREQQRSTSEIEEVRPDSVDGLRISDVASVKESPSRVGNVTEEGVSEWLWTLHRIVVDVVRTDGHLEFYEDPGNLGRMSDILAVYAWVDPATGYCQGMSDLVSPFVVLFEDNADAFWCFEMLIRRTRANFQMEGPTGVMDQLQSLPVPRELSFNEALRMWEMMWAADYDESVAETLENDCLEPLVIQLPSKSKAEIMKETRSIDDMIQVRKFISSVDEMHTDSEDMLQIFNDKVLVFSVRRCIRTAIKLRRRYVYKVIKTKSHTQSQNQDQVQIQHQTHMESKKLEETQSQRQTQSLHHTSATQNGD